MEEAHHGTWNLLPGTVALSLGRSLFVGHFYALHKSVLKDEMQKEEGEPNRELVQFYLMPWEGKEREE